MELISLLLGLYFLDIIFLGASLRLFKTSPSYRPLLRDGVLFKEMTPGYLRKIKPGGYYQSILLTPRFLIFKQNYLTSVINVPVDSINSYSIKKMGLRRRKMRMVLTVTIENVNKYIEFSTKKADDWDRFLSKVEIKRK